MKNSTYNSTTKSAINRNKIKGNILKVIKEAGEPISTDMREVLLEYFYNDIILIENITGRNLGHWKK